MLIGVHEDISAEELVKKYPGVRMERKFVSGVLSPQSLVKKFENVCKPYWDVNVIPVVSFKAKPSDVLTGKWKSHIVELARHLSLKPETWVIFYHEPEDDLNGKDFAKVFKIVRDYFKEVSSIKVGYSAMAYQWKPGSDTTEDPEFWKVVADFYGCDVYSGGSFSSKFILPEHPGFSRWYTELVVPSEGDAKWGLTERGWKASSSDAARAAEIRRETEWLKTSNCSHYIYWNTTGTENNPKLVNGPKAEQAVKEMVAYFAKPRETYHTVVRGDTLTRIAKQYDTTVSVLMDLNPHIQDSNWIFVGDVIRVS